MWLSFQFQDCVHPLGALDFDFYRLTSTAYRCMTLTYTQSVYPVATLVHLPDIRYVDLVTLTFNLLTVQFSESGTSLLLTLPATSSVTAYFVPGLYDVW